MNFRNRFQEYDGDSNSSENKDVLNPDNFLMIQDYQFSFSIGELLNGCIFDLIIISLSSLML